MKVFSGKQRLKHVLALVVTQVGCLAVGLWLHHYFVVSALRQTARENVFLGLASGADDLLAQIDRIDLRSSAMQPAQQEQLDRIFQATHPPHGRQLTLADQNWRLRATFLPHGGDGPPGRTSRQTLVWAQATESQHAATGWIRGTLTVDGRRDLALAHRLDGSGGYAVLHYPVDLAMAGTTTAFLPLVGVMTWIWTSSLLLIPVYLIVTRFYDQVTSERARAETASLRSMHALVRTRDAVIFGLAKLAESRDDTTGHHLERICTYAQRLALGMRHHPKYAGEVTAEFIDLIGISSALHDIGKVGIEDSILLKPGQLTSRQRERMKEHTVIGGSCLQEIERHLGSSNFLQMAREIAWSHHERWDGMGYPCGLSREEIPLAARIVAVADVYDALSTRRSYKEAMPHRECVLIIRDGAGTQFDPDLVEAFLKIEDVFCEIARQYANDAHEPSEPPGEAPGSGESWQREAMARLETVLEES
ncbi:MAG: HD domain-containing protein [Pirellulales bacterium]|nr:HD domain-containing protein [Pirellulales bacterium]